jgi:hypothetical protein
LRDAGIASKDHKAVDDYIEAMVRRLVRVSVKEEVAKAVAAREAADDLACAEAEAILAVHKNYKPPFTIPEFYTVWQAVHPDGDREEQVRTEAFTLLNIRKTVLCPPGGRFPPPNRNRVKLPTDAVDMWEHAARARAARAAARKAAKAAS